MSALTLLSVPAPTVPGLPHGASGEDVSGFKALLEAAEAGEDTGRSDITRGRGLDAGTGDEPVAAAADRVEDDGSTWIPDAPDLPTAAAVIHLSPLTPLEPMDGALAGGIDDIEVGGPARGNREPEPTARPDALSGAASDKSSNTASARTNEQPVMPRLAGSLPPGAPEGETYANMAATLFLSEADGTRPRHSDIPVAPPPMPGPPPPRPLAERTSKPLETLTAGAGDAARIGEAGPTKGVAVASTPAVTASPAGPKDAIAIPPIATRSPDGSPPEIAPSGDGSAGETDTPAVVRETALSQLSRVTIEATAQIAAQILRRLEGRSTRFEMALTPEELGRVDVKLDIDAEGRLKARLAFDNPAAATDLRGRVDELRRQLEDAGFDLAEDALEFAERDSGSSAFDRGEDARKAPSRAFTAAARLNAEIDVAQPPGWMALSLSPSGVDMKV